jgi:hypothetical protein
MHGYFTGLCGELERAGIGEMQGTTLNAEVEPLRVRTAARRRRGASHQDTIRGKT